MPIPGSYLRSLYSLAPVTGVSVAGYKSIRDECSIEIAPLTLLAGANSSGKSSIVQPLLLLKQTLEANYDAGPLLINGPNVRFTEAKQILSRAPRLARVSEFRVRVAKGKRASLGLAFRQTGVGFDIAEMLVEDEHEKRSLRPGMSGDELQKMLHRDIQALRKDGLPFPPDESLTLHVLRDWCFLAVGLRSDKRRGQFPAVYSPGLILSEDLRGIIHVPGLRGNPERTYRKTPIGPDFPGTFENYVASVIHRWKETKDPNLAGLADALERLGLTWKITASPVDDASLEVKVGRLPHSRRGYASDLVSIADVGMGVSEVLPVLVALLAARKEQIVFIEQPEFHLHPNAQHELASVIADAAKRRARLIVETHSSLLLLGIQRLIAEGKLNPNLVRLHWFQRDSETGKTSVASVTPDVKGAFGDWPEDFDKVLLEAQGKYMDAVERTLAAGR